MGVFVGLLQVCVCVFVGGGHNLTSKCNTELTELTLWSLLAACETRCLKDDFFDFCIYYF